MVGGHPNPTDVLVSRLSRVDGKTKDKKGGSGFDNKHTARGAEKHTGVTERIQKRAEKTAIQPEKCLQVD